MVGPTEFSSGWDGCCLCCVALSTISYKSNQVSSMLQQRWLIGTCMLAIECVSGVSLALKQRRGLQLQVQSSLFVTIMYRLTLCYVCLLLYFYFNNCIFNSCILCVWDRFTTACFRGRTTIVTMRCDPQQTGNGTIELPSRCPDGTCDGCVYLFLWTSQFACPRCNEDNYTDVVEECSGGKQKVVRLKPKYDISPSVWFVTFSACN